MSQSNETSKQRQRNLRTAVILASCALVFFAGFIYRIAHLHV